MHHRFWRSLVFTHNNNFKHILACSTCRQEIIDLFYNYNIVRPNWLALFLLQRLTLRNVHYFQFTVIIFLLSNDRILRFSNNISTFLITKPLASVLSSSESVYILHLQVTSGSIWMHCLLLHPFLFPSSHLLTKMGNEKTPC